jgi:glycerol-3-phosphate dehydrogenase
LPGGDFPVGTADGITGKLRRDYPFLAERDARRLVRHYGTEAWDLLGDARKREDLGRGFGGPLTEAEVVFLMEREYARTADDVVWRRTKAGLHMRHDEIAALDRWMRDRRVDDVTLRTAAE